MLTSTVRTVLYKDKFIKTIVSSYKLMKKIVKNRFIPPRGFSYVNLFGVLFTTRDIPISDVSLNHEQIHTEQMKEMLYVFFYLWYLIEWLIRLIILRDSHKAYRAISFEQEAYANQENLTYLEGRKRYRWISYLF